MCAGSLKICDVLCPHRCLGDDRFDCCNSECTGSCRAVEDETMCSVKTDSTELLLYCGVSSC